ncbi:S1 RNA-binding domain-containing protein [Ferruginibacter yonginensis]|uniref:S1 RNA-binding domain-containing protein n=1 Tax=Ferruginibacter yonginensis TaxID=1310416 RepID=A0ABV8QRP9_9BACT
MILAGQYNEMKVLRTVEFGVYLDDGNEGILLPKRFVPDGLVEGDTINVFVYHDSEDRLIATTQQPLGIVGDFVKLKAVSVTPLGAFLDWGLMKDLFVPKSQQITGMRPLGEYLVKIYRDEQTGRTAATERIEQFLNNDVLTVAEGDEVDMVVMRRTDIGYLMIINKQHTGVLHLNEVYRTIGVGDHFKGFVKKIYPDNRIDVVAGKKGYTRVEDETTKVLRLLKENDGYLPYNDKSDPEAIYLFFGMSKKTFKMTTGNLYKNRKISFEKTGIKLVED